MQLYSFIVVQLCSAISVVYVIDAVRVVNEINVLSYFGVVNVDTVVGFSLELSVVSGQVG